MARRLVITENVTLDGVVENDGTWFDPTENSDRGRELAAVTAAPAPLQETQPTLRRTVPRGDP